MKFLIFISVAYSLLTSIVICFVYESGKFKGIWFNNYFKNAILYIPAFILDLVSCFSADKNLIVSGVVFIVILVFISMPFIVRITNSGCGPESKSIKTVFSIIINIAYISLILYAVFDLLQDTGVFFTQSVFILILKYVWISAFLLWLIYKTVCYVKKRN